MKDPFCGMDVGAFTDAHRAGQNGPIICGTIVVSRSLGVILKDTLPYLLRNQRAILLYIIRKGWVEGV